MVVEITTTSEEIKRVLDGINLQPPAESEFMGGDFIRSETLERLARVLVERHAELGFIDEHGFTFQVLWKRRGGTKGGRQTLGKCLLQTGLTKFYSGQDWVIWLAADHVRLMGLNAHGMEALVFHELKHCAMNEDPESEEPPTPATIGHDVEMFLSEVENYGIWASDIARAAEVFGKQLGLFGGEAKQQEGPAGQDAPMEDDNDATT